MSVYFLEPGGCHYATGPERRLPQRSGQVAIGVRADIARSLSFGRD
jgi:hypothetical protein